MQKIFSRRATYNKLGNYFFAQPVHNLRRQKFLLRIKETANNIWPGKH